MTVFVSPNYRAPHTSAADTTTSAKELVNCGFNILLIGGFVIGLAVPFLGLFQGDVSQKIEQSEGRPAAAFPTFEMKGSGFFKRPATSSLKDFPRQFEKWLNDRIGLRRPLIQLYQFARYYHLTPGLLAKTPSRAGLTANAVTGHMSQGSLAVSGQDRVLIGRDGWLFFRTDDVIRNYRGTDLFSENELKRWRRVLTERRDWLAKRGIRYLLVIAPNKHSVYPEQMPRAIHRVSTNSRLVQLTAYMKRHSDVTVLNLLDPLVRSKSEQRVFHKTDTHWNAYGAFIGAQEILERLKAWYPDVCVPGVEDYDLVVHDCDTQTVKNVSPWIKMDLAAMLSSPIPYREKVIDLVPRRPSLSVPVQLPGIPRSQEDLVQKQTSEHGQIPSVFVLHDSYMMALAPFLAPHFRNVTYHWKNDFPAEEIKKARPVVVIQQLVERRLMDQKPGNPPLVTEELHYRDE